HVPRRVPHGPPGTGHSRSPSARRDYILLADMVSHRTSGADTVSDNNNVNKLGELEALRGIASVIVLVHHALLGFAPGLHGLLQPDSPHALFGTPAFSLINGGAAVVLFFVLSGFVLTFRALEK